MKVNREIQAYLLIVLIGIIFFLPYLGKVHLFDWDEINFAEAAREMIVTGDYLTVRIDYEPFHEKPPFFFWLQAGAMHIFGINSFAARFPDAAAGIITLLLLFTLGNKLFDEKFGLLWVVAYIGSFLPHFYFKSGIIDPVFNLFMFLGIYFSYRYFQKKSSQKKISLINLITAGLFSALAVLTKGPVGWFLIILSWLVFWLIKRKELRFPFLEIGIFTIISFIPYAVWYSAAALLRGADVFDDFLRYHIRLLTTEDAGHGGPIYYHFLILFFGCFPASVLALRGFRKQDGDSFSQRNFKIWMIILLCVVLIVFSIVETKIIHYSSLSYFPLTFLAAYAMHSMVFGKMPLKTSTAWLTGIIGFIWAALFALLPLALMNVEMILPKVTDKFTHALLQTDVPWQGWEFLIGLLYLASIAAALVLLQKRLLLKGFITLFAGTAVTIFIFLPVTVPKIEIYTQGAPIEFFKTLKGKDVYIEVLGYKSYAHYFYAEKPPELSAHNFGISKSVFREWLLTGDINKDAYFVCKNKKAGKYTAYKGVKKLYDKSGFVFLKREAGKN